MSRVVPATSVTMARWEPLQALSRLDLPTLGRPTSATCSPLRSSCPARCVCLASEICTRSKGHRSQRLGLGVRVLRLPRLRDLHPLEMRQ